jgi:GNAT superfamily N-acetyltransferase
MRMYFTAWSGFRSIVHRRSMSACEAPFRAWGRKNCQIPISGVRRAALGVRVERIIGPTYLGYKDVAGESPADPNVRLLGVDEGALLDHLRNNVTSLEWAHGGLEDCRPIAGYFLDGALVAAAGFEVWGGTLAHVCVTTHAGRRSLGFGRACVRGVAEVAIKSGFVAQYQTLFDNEPSIAVTHALEFEEYGRRIFVRCKEV